MAGCGEIDISEAERSFTVRGRTVNEGEWITIDGTTGDLMLGQLPLIQPEFSGDFVLLVKWADAYRKIGVRTNADTPTDAAASMDFGAEGIGLCRTEHMFFVEDRIIAMREMIVAEEAEANFIFEMLSHMLNEIGSNLIVNTLSRNHFNLIIKRFGSLVFGNKAAFHHFLKHKLLSAQ